MGLFDKAKQAKQSAADAMAQAGAMQQQAGVPMGADMPGMGGQDMAAMAAMSAKMNKIAQSGVEAPGVIHTITATGSPDPSPTLSTPPCAPKAVVSHRQRSATRPCSTPRCSTTPAPS